MRRRNVSGAALCSALIGTALALLGGEAQSQTAVPPELAARLEKEKAARAGCKAQICKAFATPEAGAPIACDMVRTWVRDDLTSRIVGGSYVWGYGHVRCTFTTNLDRAEIVKMRSGAAGQAKFAEHALKCDVEDKDSAKGIAFSFTANVTPKIDFDKRQVTAVNLDPIKTEGSALASAAVTSLQAIDKVSSVISKSGTKEFNSFVYTRCKEDGIVVPE